MKFLLIFLTLCTLTLSSCIGTEAGAYRFFSNNLERQKGKSIDEAGMHFISLKDTKPTLIKELKNGNEIREYHVERNLRGIFSKYKQDCYIYVELDLINNQVVNTSSRGDGCWHAY